MPHRVRAPVVLPTQAIDYYDTSSVPITPTGETGIRGTGTPGQFFITGNWYQDGLLLRDRSMASGLPTSSTIPTVAGDQFITNVYGPDPLNATTLHWWARSRTPRRGAMTSAASSSKEPRPTLRTPRITHQSSFPTPRHLCPQHGRRPGRRKLLQHRHPRRGRLRCWPRLHLRRCPASRNYRRRVPGRDHTSVYAIWYNGGTSYTIAGGYSLGFVDDLANQDDLFGTAFLADYDSATGQFSHWTPFSAPGGGNVLSHFEGLSSVDNGIYTMSAVATPGLTTQPIQGYLVTVARAADGNFGTAVWTPLDDPAGTATSANSVYGNQVVGVLSGASPPGYQATVNGGDAAT